MDIFENITVILNGDFDLINEFSFLGEKVINVSLDKFDNKIFGINIVFNKSDKEKILLKIVKKLKFPKSGARNNWEFAKSTKSDFSEYILERNKYMNINDVSNVDELLEFDVLKWENSKYILTILNHSLIRGFSGDYFYINIREV